MTRLCINMALVLIALSPVIGYCTTFPGDPCVSELECCTFVGRPPAVCMPFEEGGQTFCVVEPSTNGDDDY